MSRVRAYLQLVRLPNLFTALADVLAGYWLFSQTPGMDWTLVCLAGASACLYSAGIVINDLRDLQIDRLERPTRPLPSGIIQTRTARTLAIIFCIAGVGVPILQFWFDHVPVRTVLTAACLLAAILAYDLAAKFTFLGPSVMGLCRTLNLYLGMSVFWSPAMQWPAIALLAILLYVMSFTYFGRDEASISTASRLLLGAGGVAVSLVLLGGFAAPRMAEDTFTLILWFILIVHLGRITRRAILDPQPARVGYAMKTFILCIILFDAVVVSTAQNWPYPLIVLALLIPAVFAGRFLYST